jgi:hypothetical protein
MVVAALASAFLSIMTVAQVMRDLKPMAVTNQAAAPLASLPLPQANLSGFATAERGFRGGTIMPGDQEVAGMSPPLDPKPGVYRTVPYSCIVVVPGERLDDGIAVAPGKPGSSMSVIKPELQFIPLH